MTAKRWSVKVFCLAVFAATLLAVPACAAGPPAQPGPFRPSDLVEQRRVIEQGSWSPEVLVHTK